MLEILVSLSLLFSHAVASHTPVTSATSLQFVHDVTTSGPARFRIAERAVSNWRRETLWSLSLAPLSIWKLTAGRPLEGLPRCVKLNNYWCIKKAGWNGEIAADPEGHVAFASALEGAKVAAALLRRYYMTYNLHSARDIISRWAPAQCGTGGSGPLVIAARPNVVRFASRAAPALTLQTTDHDDFGLKQSKVIKRDRFFKDIERHAGGKPESTFPHAAPAPRGLQNTLRGRWLATHTRGGFRRAGKSAPVRRSVVADHALRMMAAPEIAVGMGERDIKLKPIEFGKLAPSASILGLSPLSCTSDWPRIDAYSARAAAGIAASPHEDLMLFTAEGRPTPHLARLMRNMAAVEIGPLSVRDWLIGEAIATALPATVLPATTDPAR